MALFENSWVLHPTIITIMALLLSIQKRQAKNLPIFEIKKTDENVLYLLSFLALLKERELLKFNLGTVSWQWDMDEIDASTNATMNVV